MSWIKKEFIKIRSCAISRWINCLDRISTYSKIDKGLSFHFEFLSLCFHYPTNCSSSGSLIPSAHILNIQWRRRQTSSFYHGKQFFDFFPPPPHFYCFPSTNSIFLFFTIHHHHRNVVVVVGKYWKCGGGGKTVESNLKEIKISEYFFLLLLFFSSLGRSEIPIFVPDILMGLRISYFFGALCEN